MRTNLTLLETSGTVASCTFFVWGMNHWLWHCPCVTQATPPSTNTCPYSRCVQMLKMHTHNLQVVLPSTTPLISTCWAVACVSRTCSTSSRRANAMPCPHHVSRQTRANHRGMTPTASARPPKCTNATNTDTHYQQGAQPLPARHGMPCSCLLCVQQNRSQPSNPMPAMPFTTSTTLSFKHTDYERIHS